MLDSLLNKFKKGDSGDKTTETDVEEFTNTVEVEADESSSDDTNTDNEIKSNSDSGDDKSEKKKPNKKIQIIIGALIVAYGASEVFLPKEEAPQEKTVFKKKKPKKVEKKKVVIPEPEKVAAIPEPEPVKKAPEPIPTPEKIKKVVSIPAPEPIPVPKKIVKVEKPKPIPQPTIEKKMPQVVVAVEEPEVKMPAPKMEKKRKEIGLVENSMSNSSSAPAVNEATKAEPIALPSKTASRAITNFKDLSLKSEYKENQNIELELLNKESVMRPDVIVKKYSSPPPYDIKGKGLVYNCKMGHWACVNRDQFINCAKNYSFNLTKRNKQECVTVQVFQSTFDCRTAQTYKINNVASTNFCKN